MQSCFAPSKAYNLSMSSVMEIQAAIQKLSPKEKATLTTWLESQEEPLLSEDEEAALLKRLDNAAKQLDAGQGVPLDEVRSLVRKWASK
jgi:hypothetical protein